MIRLVGGPFDGREFDAKGVFLKIPCRDFYAAPTGREPYIAHTVAVYEPDFTVDLGHHYLFSHEEVVYDGYVDPVPS